MTSTNTKLFQAFHPGRCPYKGANGFCEYYGEKVKRCTKKCQEKHGAIEREENDG